MTIEAKVKPVPLWMWFLAALPCGLPALLIWLGEKEKPRLLDDEGVTLRDGRRFRWGDVQCVKIRHGYELRSMDGARIPLSHAMFENGDDVMRFIVEKGKPFGGPR